MIMLKDVERQVAQYVLHSVLLKKLPAKLFAVKINF